VRVFPSSALQFWAYPEMKKLLFGSRETLSPIERLSAGACAGAIAQTITYPLDFIRARLTVDKRGVHNAGMWRALVDVTRAEGPLALYRGLTPSLVGIMPYVGIDFAMYDVLRAQMPRRAPDSDEPSVLGKLIAGGIAGASAQVCVRGTQTLDPSTGFRCYAALLTPRACTSVLSRRWHIRSTRYDACCRCRTACTLRA